MSKDGIHMDPETLRKRNSRIRRQQRPDAPVGPQGRARRHHRERYLPRGLSERRPRPDRGHALP